MKKSKKHTFKVKRSPKKAKKAFFHGFWEELGKLVAHLIIWVLCATLCAILSEVSLSFCTVQKTHTESTNTAEQVIKNPLSPITSASQLQ